MNDLLDAQRFASDEAETERLRLEAARETARRAEDDAARIQPRTPAVHAAAIAAADTLRRCEFESDVARCEALSDITVRLRIIAILESRR